MPLFNSIPLSLLSIRPSSPSFLSGVSRLPPPASSNQTPPKPRSLRDKVIHHLEVLKLVPLRNDHVPHIPPLPANILESPNLRREPARISNDMAKDQITTIAPLPIEREEVRVHPALLPRLPSLIPDEGREVRARDELGLPLDGAEDPVLVLAHGPVERALLARAAEPAGRLVDVDVRRARLGIRVLLHGYRDGRRAYALADEPADALEGERRVCRVREGFVLFFYCIN